MVTIQDTIFSECSVTGMTDYGGALYIEMTGESGNGLQLERNDASKCSAILPSDLKF
jgi:hypothetical protein